MSFTMNDLAQEDKRESTVGFYLDGQDSDSNKDESRLPRQATARPAPPRKLTKKMSIDLGEINVNIINFTLLTI
jgi:hypothetical protein